jgi:cytochrome P450
MNRLVTRSIKLSDGSLLPAGVRIMVANSFTDPSVYTDPEIFDPYRSLGKREQLGQRMGWQHVSLSPEHMAFGYGRHACPGRFFASNEIKVALCHLLTEYDWELSSTEMPEFCTFETNMIVNPMLKLRVRKRDSARVA